MNMFNTVGTILCETWWRLGALVNVELKPGFPLKRKVAPFLRNLSHVQIDEILESVDKALSNTIYLYITSV